MSLIGSKRDHALLKDALIKMGTKLNIDIREVDTTTGLIHQWVTSHAPVVQINAITSLAQKVIGDNDKAKKWLSEPNIALDNKAPVTLLGDRQGYERVRTLLLRIEYGVLS